MPKDTLEASIRNCHGRPSTSGLLTNSGWPAVAVIPISYRLNNSPQPSQADVIVSPRPPVGIGSEVITATVTRRTPAGSDARDLQSKR